MGRATRFAIGLLLYAVALPVHAATITVTNTNDSGAGSLRQALSDGNNGDTINFAVTGTITLTSGELLVDKSLTISGPGIATVAVDGNTTSRVFHIGSGKTVSIFGLNPHKWLGWFRQRRRHLERSRDTNAGQLRRAEQLRPI